MLAKVLPTALALLLTSSVALAQDEAPAAEPAESGDATPPGTAAPATPTGVGGRLPAGAVSQPAGGLTHNPGKLTLQGLNARLSAARDRGERLRARVNVLKDAILQGGPSADASLVHVNRMGDQFRLIELRYTIDGTTVYSQRDESGSMHDKKTIDILDGPIAPGPHTLKVEMVYRGHGYGPFKYLNKQTFNVEGSETFTASTGKLVEIQSIAYERDDSELANRPAVSFKASKAASKKPPTAPPSEPLSPPAPAPVDAAPADAAAPGEAAGTPGGE